MPKIKNSCCFKICGKSIFKKQDRFFASNTETRPIDLYTLSFCLKRYLTISYNMIHDFISLQRIAKKKITSIVKQIIVGFLYINCALWRHWVASNQFCILVMFHRVKYWICTDQRPLKGRVCRGALTLLWRNGKKRDLYYLVRMAILSRMGCRFLSRIFFTD